jgi:hypothetical protein
MGIFAIAASLGIGVWLIGRMLGARSVEAEGATTLRTSMSGAQAVSSEIFGALGGPVAPDFGPAPVSGLEVDPRNNLQINPAEITAPPPSWEVGPPTSPPRPQDR